ncbi:MAG: phage tail family protein [Eubacterium sp.]|nr:phage tail family protein [Eubacterium sp.]
MSIYPFVDTTELPTNNFLPSEAMKIDGEYIENQIEGYRTLYVSGREPLVQALNYFESEAVNGGRYKSKKFPIRTLTIGYQLLAETPEEFREKFNQLGGILNTLDAELIFADEPDKYFVGSPSELGEVPTGRNSITSEFTVTCLDPFKYSTETNTVSHVSDEKSLIVIDYGGTAPAYPVLTAAFPRVNSSVGEETSKGDCGYVAFFDDEEHIIQMGDPEEEDTANLPKSQVLVNQAFTTYSSSNWPANAGITPGSNFTKTGAAAIKTDGASKKMVAGNTFGSGTNWHGPTITRTIPADGGGAIGAANFRVDWSQRMCLSNWKNNRQKSSVVKQKGAFQLSLVNVSGSTRKIIAGIKILKSSSGDKATLYMTVNGSDVFSKSIALTYYNTFFGYNKKKSKKSKATTAILSSMITKSGGTVSFNIAGLKKSFTDDNIASTLVHEITVGFYNYGTAAGLYNNGCHSIKFTKDACDTVVDIPNKFSAGDEVSADCREGQIFLNGKPVPEFGALGNDWETFVLTPGENQIGVAWSDWVETECEPSCSVTYREVFL